MNHNYTLVDPIDEEYQFGDKIDNKEHFAALNSLSTVSYRYIDWDKTPYHFQQECFDNEDAVNYFWFMSMLTDNPFNKLFNTRKKEWHLNPNDYGKDKNFRDLVNLALDLQENLPIACQPSFFHFALYTNQDANRDSKIKSPRIYFFIGANAVIYPLFYDPYHEINPMSSN